jgi:hypothetical protein
MGGNALKNTTTRRYDAAEYEFLVDEVLATLQKKYFLRCNVLPAYRLKPSFGDMDVLVEKNHSIDWFINMVHDAFRPNEVFSNGGVISFDFKELQIDLVLVGKENYASAFAFFSWNDLGNFIGKIAHKFGLKYGIKGLEYVHRTQDQSKIFGRINLSKDPSVILPFLGFDYERWLEGFDTKEEIFDFIVNSKYFNPEMFRFKNLSAEHKKRNRRRDMYLDFLNYVESLENSVGVQYYPFYKDKTEYHFWIEENFSGFKAKLADLEHREERARKAKQKFNGKLVMDKYGYEGKELGKLLGNFKKEFDTEGELNQFLVNTSQEQVWDYFEKVNGLK